MKICIEERYSPFCPSKKGYANICPCQVHIPFHVTTLLRDISGGREKAGLKEFLTEKIGRIEVPVEGVGIGPTGPQTLKFEDTAVTDPF